MRVASCITFAAHNVHFSQSTHDSFVVRLFVCEKQLPVQRSFIGIGNILMTTLGSTSLSDVFTIAQPSNDVIFNMSCRDIYSLGHHG